MSALLDLLLELEELWNIIGMSSRRPFLADAASARQLLQKHASLHGIRVSNQRHHCTIFKMDSEEDQSLFVEQRLPCTRPIDRRWDRSRGILFNNAKRSHSADFTWSRDNGIVFVNTPASKRGYAMNPNARPAPHPPSPPQEKTARSQNAVMNDHLPPRMDALPSSNMYEKMKRAEEAHDAIKARSENDKRELQDKFEKDIKQLQETIKKLEQKLADQQKGFEKKKQELTRQIDERDRKIKRREDDLAAEQSRLTANIARAKQDAKEAADGEVKRRIEAADRREKQATSDVERYRKEHNRAMDRLVEESNKELRELQSRLTQKMAQILVKELREMRENGLYREEVERKDYEAYHQVWDEIGNSFRAYLSETSVFSKRLSDQFERWNGAAQSLGQWKKDQWFPHTYPELDQRLEAFSRVSAERTEQKVNNLKDLRNSALDAHAELSREAHVSRMLTRHHQFEPVNNKDSEATLVSSILNEVPLNDLKALIDQEIEQIKGKLDAATHESTKESLQQRLELVKSRRTVVSMVLTFYIHFREYKGLQALRQDTTSEKAVFLATQKARKLLEQARSDWNHYTTENPKVAFDSDVSPEQQERDRKDFLKKYHEARVSEEGLSELIRKRHLVEIYLQETKGDEAEYDAAIDKELVRAKATMDASLDRLARRMTVGGGWVPQVSSFRPRSIPPVTSPSPVKAERRRWEVESELRALGEKRKGAKANETDEERKMDELKIRDLKLEHHRIQVTALTGKRAEVLRKTPNDHASALRLQQEIERLKAAIKRAEHETQPRQENTKMDAVKSDAEESNASMSDAAKPATPKRRRARPTIRRLNSEGGRDSVKRVVPKTRESPDSGENSADAAPASTVDGRQRSAETGMKFVNFKATSGQQAPHPYWTDNIRSLHSGNAKQNNAPSTPVSDSPPRSTYNTFEAGIPLSHALRQLSLGSAHAGNSSVHMDSDANQLSNQVSELDDSFGFPPDHENTHSASPISLIADAETSSHHTSSIDQHFEIDPSSDQQSTMRSEDSATTTSEAEYEAAAESDVELTYKIPAHDYRSAVIASKNTEAAFWNFKLYKNAESKYPKVLYCVNFETSEARAREFLNESIIGFDMEWEPWAAMAKSSPKHNVSLIQIAAEDKIGLFHLAMFSGDTPDKLMPPSLRAILESRRIAKAGVNVSGDANRLRKCLNVEMQGLFELSHLYRVVELSQSAPAQVNKRLVKLAEQVQTILGLPLKKDAVQTSAWSKKLHMEQTDYAASDAYAGYHLYRALEAKRKKMNPMPPRPAFWEDQQPLQLGNGRIIYPSKSQPAKRKREDPDEGLVGVIEADDDECEEFFDTAEGLDADHIDASLSSLESSQRSGSISDSFISLQSEEDSQDADLAVHSQDRDLFQPLHSSQLDESLPSTSYPSAKRTKGHPPPSPAIDRAETWATNWRASLPTEYKLTARHAELRAYHMWHEQRLDCEEVAALLNITPRTVSSYVMQAIKTEDLPFDAERVSEPLELLPKSVHGRYRKVLEKAG